jgi:hypothetical protein
MIILAHACQDARAAFDVVAQQHGDGKIRLEDGRYVGSEVNPAGQYQAPENIQSNTRIPRTKVANALGVDGPSGCVLGSRDQMQGAIWIAFTKDLIDFAKQFQRIGPLRRLSIR